MFVEDLVLVGYRDGDELSGDALTLLKSLESDGVLAPGPSAAALAAGDHPARSPGASAQHWDAFISHASEDKAGLVADLAKELSSRDIRIWYDDKVLQV